MVELDPLQRVLVLYREGGDPIIERPRRVLEVGQAEQLILDGAAGGVAVADHGDDPVEAATVDCQGLLRGEPLVDDAAEPLAAQAALEPRDPINVVELQGPSGQLHLEVGGRYAVSGVFERRRDALIVVFGVGLARRDRGCLGLDRGRRTGGRLGQARRQVRERLPCHVLQGRVQRDLAHRVAEYRAERDPVPRLLPLPDHLEQVEPCARRTLQRLTRRRPRPRVAPAGADQPLGVEQQRLVGSPAGRRVTEGGGPPRTSPVQELVVLTPLLHQSVEQLLLRVLQRRPLRGVPVRRRLRRGGQIGRIRHGQRERREGKRQPSPPDGQEDWRLPRPPLPGAPGADVGVQGLRRAIGRHGLRPAPPCHPRQPALDEVGKGRTPEAVGHPALLARLTRTEDRDLDVGSLDLDVVQRLLETLIGRVAEDSQLAVAVDLGQIEHDQHVPLRILGNLPDQIDELHLFEVANHRRGHREHDRLRLLVPHLVLQDIAQPGHPGWLGRVGRSQVREAPDVGLQVGYVVIRHIVGMNAGLMRAPPREPQEQPEHQHRGDQRRGPLEDALGLLRSGQGGTDDGCVRHRDQAPWHADDRGIRMPVRWRMPRRSLS